MATAMLAGCVTHSDLNIDPAKAAHIRVTSTNAAGWYQKTHLYPDATCAHYDNPQKIIGNGFLAGSKSLNMPKTAETSAQFREYVVPAGKPLTVQMTLSHDDERCGPIYAKFVPVAGRMYEIDIRDTARDDRFLSYFATKKRDACYPVVSEWREQSSATPTPIHLMPAEHCEGWHVGEWFGR